MDTAKKDGGGYGTMGKEYYVVARVQTESAQFCVDLDLITELKGLALISEAKAIIQDKLIANGYVDKADGKSTIIITSIFTEIK